MATSVEARRPATEGAGWAETIAAWVSAHRQAALYLAGGVAVAVFLIAWTFWSSRQSEARAGAQLQQARLAFETRNFALASNELSRIVENYSGTNAAQEASILLGHARLLQGQTQQAIELLRTTAADVEPAYRAQGYGLLGAAYENAGRPRDAAEAYQRAAEAARLPFLEAQHLSDAGRAWVAAGDTTRAVASYRRIVDELSKTPQVDEAKVRLGELMRGANAVLR